MSSKVKRTRAALVATHNAAVALHQERGLLANRLVLVRIRLQEMDTDAARAAIAELDLPWKAAQAVLASVLDAAAKREAERVA